MDATEPHCRRVIYAGRVQGVGFRYTTSGIARRFPVRGFVRNLADGTVELVAAGTVRGVEEFLREVERRFIGNINAEATSSDVIPRPEEFAGFEIRANR